MDKNMKILIVDDFSTMRRVIKNLMRDSGFTNTFEADDGYTALPMLKEGDFDFIVTTWDMPIMNGIDLLKHIRKDPKLKNLTVLMVLESQNKEHMTEATQAGANGCLVAPFTAGALTEELDRVLG